MVMMKVAGRAVAISDRACLAVRHASAAGLSGRPNVTLQKKGYFLPIKNCWHAKILFQAHKTFFMCISTEHVFFIMFINVKMPTIVGILTFISMINTTSESLKARKIFIFSVLVFMSS